MTGQSLNADDRSPLVHTAVIRDIVTLQAGGPQVSLTPTQALTHGTDLISHAAAATTGRPADRELESAISMALVRAVTEWAEAPLDPDLRRLRK